MVDEIVVNVTDLAKKHPGKPAYKGLFSLVKFVYQDDGQVATESFAIDKENLEILRAKIDAVLIGEDQPMKK